MSSQTTARKEPLTVAKKREKREKAITEASEGATVSGNEAKDRRGRRPSLAERRMNSEKEMTKKREAAAASDDQDSKNATLPPDAIPAAVSGTENDANSSEQGPKREVKLSLAEMRIQREQEMAENLQKNRGVDGIAHTPAKQINGRNRNNDEVTRSLAPEMRAQRDKSPNYNSDGSHSQQRRKKGRSEPLTVAKQRAKREKAVEEAIRDTVAPIETEEEVKERLKKFNVNIDESARLFRQAIHEAYENQQGTDTTVQVDHDVFSAHSLVLSTASSFFDKKIRFGKCSYVRISHPKLPGHVFKHILEFFYSGSLNPGVIVDLMTQGMAFLGVTPAFQKMYGLSLSSELPLMEYFSTWLALSQVGLPVAGDVILKHVLREFPKLTPDLRFFQLGTRQIVDLLSSDDLNTENEETVCDMALHWLGQNDWKEEDAAAVFRALRLHRVSTSYLERYVEDYPLLSHFPACMKIVEDVRYFHDQPGRRHDFYDKRLHFRSVSPLTEAMVIFGGVKVDGSPSNMMMAFNFNTRAWCSLGKVPFSISGDFAYCTYDNDIYVSGGKSSPLQMVRFVATKVRWTKCKDMRIARSGHCMQVVDTSIYVLGGIDQNLEVISEIEEYAVLTGTWRAGNKLIFSVKDANSAVIKDKIYLFGGKMDHKSHHNSSVVQCFDPRKGSVSVINTMVMSLQQSSSLKINKYTYVINQDGRVYEISDDHLTVTEIGSIPEFNRKKFGLYVHHGKILILGGHFKDKVFGEIVCFEPNLHAALVCPWEDMMPPVRSNFAVVKTVLAKADLNDELLTIDVT